MYLHSEDYLNQKVERLEDENAELRNKIAALQSDRDYWQSRANESYEYICVDRENGLWKRRKNKP